jgi:broad specificity phosphatase PhoE
MASARLGQNRADGTGIDGLDGGGGGLTSGSKKSKGGHGDPVEGVGGMRLAAGRPSPCLTQVVTRLLLLRHAESDWNAAGLWQGMADPALSARGEAQAASAGGLLAGYGFSAVVSSDLQRARATAASVAAALMLPAPAVDRGLREYDVGDWSGLTRPEIEARWPGGIDDWREGRLVSTPHGERRDVFVRRITAAVERVGAAHRNTTVVVITHGGVISALARSLGIDAGRVAHLAGRWIDAGPMGLRAGPALLLLDSDSSYAPAGEGVADTGAR